MNYFITYFSIIILVGDDGSNSQYGHLSCRQCLRSRLDGLQPTTRIHTWCGLRTAGLPSPSTSFSGIFHTSHFHTGREVQHQVQSFAGRDEAVLDTEPKLQQKIGHRPVSCFSGMMFTLQDEKGRRTDRLKIEKKKTPRKIAGENLKQDYYMNCDDRNL